LAIEGVTKGAARRKASLVVAINTLVLLKLVIADKQHEQRLFPFTTSSVLVVPWRLIQLTE